RQRGGAIGLRGPGETQLELDRRIIGEKMKQLQKRLDKVEVQRNQARRARQRNAVPVVALVGYTNAGKSTLFNALTGSEVYAANQLFATLDPTVRRLEGLDVGPVVLADTVGFIRDLPHDLVAAFRSTLSEARDADLLLHVVDASDPERDDRMADVDTVLREIGAGDLPQVLVFNKIDLIADAVPRLDSIDGGATQRAWVSAATGAGFEGLKAGIEQKLGAERVRAELHVPSSLGRLRARLHAQGVVAGEDAEDSGWAIRIDAPLALVEPLFGLPGGDGEWLRGRLLARPTPPTYNYLGDRP
ncbi:MAG TPA: GTPase HflX, partial [Rhodanobacteraceae bacterium]|nr:GTPase HflX [Rhodanobacteraceae bacterium]